MNFLLILCTSLVTAFHLVEIRGGQHPDGYALKHTEEGVTLSLNGKDLCSLILEGTTVRLVGEGSLFKLGSTFESSSEFSLGETDEVALAHPIVLQCKSVTQLKKRKGALVKLRLEKRPWGLPTRRQAINVALKSLMLTFIALIFLFYFAMINFPRETARLVENFSPADYVPTLPDLTNLFPKFSASSSNTPLASYGDMGEHVVKFCRRFKAGTSNSPVVMSVEKQDLETRQVTLRVGFVDLPSFARLYLPLEVFLDQENAPKLVHAMIADECHRFQ